MPPVKKKAHKYNNDPKRGKKYAKARADGKSKKDSALEAGYSLSSANTPKAIEERSVVGPELDVWRARVITAFTKDIDDYIALVSGHAKQKKDPRLSFDATKYILDKMTPQDEQSSTQAVQVNIGIEPKNTEQWRGDGVQPKWGTCESIKLSIPPHNIPYNL